MQCLKCGDFTSRVTNFICFNAIRKSLYMRWISSGGLFSLSFLNALSLGVRIICGLAVNKVMSAALGSGGFAVFGQAQNILSLLSAFANNGVSAGVTKLTAEHIKNPTIVSRIWRVSFLASLMFGLLLSIALAIFAVPLSNLLFKGEVSTSVIYVIAIAVPFACCAPVPLAALNGQQASLARVTAPLLANIFAAGVSIYLCSHFGLIGSIWSVVTSQCSALLLNSLFFFRLNPIASWGRLQNREFNVVRPLAEFALMALVGGIASQLAQLYIRTSIVQAAGWGDAGLWQASIKISDIYLSLATSTLTIYYLPKLARTETRKDFIDLLRHALIWIVPATILGCLAVYVNRAEIIRLAFSSDFLPVADFLWVQILADVFKITSFLFAMVMWAKKMTKVYMITETSFSALYVVFASILIPKFGIIGALSAQALMYFLYLVVCAVISLSQTPWIRRETALS